MQRKSRMLYAMIALRALPGAPGYDGNDNLIIEQALSDLDHYVRAGVDGVILENDHDIPFIKPPLPEEALVLVSEVARRVRKAFAGSVGLQLLEAANEESLTIAGGARLDFIRVEGYVYAHVGGAGLIEACAGKLQRLRARLGYFDVKIYADMKKKHCSHALTADLTIVDEVKQAEFFLVDGVVVTGARTGEEPSTSDLEAVRAASSLPLLIGSGMTAENISRYIGLADGFIVGSTFRKEGRFLEQLDPDRLTRFMACFRSAAEGVKSASI